MDLAYEVMNSSPMNIMYATKDVGNTAINIADEM